MNSCIVEKEIGAIGPSPSELFPFVVLAFKLYIFVYNFYTCFQILFEFILHMHIYIL